MSECRVNKWSLDDNINTRDSKAYEYSGLLLMFNNMFFMLQIKSIFVYKFSHVEFVIQWIVGWDIKRLLLTNDSWEEVRFEITKLNYKYCIKCAKYSNCFS